MEKAIASYNPTSAAVGVYSSTDAFEHWQRIAQMLAKSTLVPENYRTTNPNGLANSMVALEIANRIGMSPLMVMQNMNIIEGRPTWAAKFLIAAINTSGDFGKLRFEMEERGEKTVKYAYWEGPKGARVKKEASVKINDLACRAVTTDKEGNILSSPCVSVEMAVKEGWFTRNGSKWATMPELMLRYRAASMFSNLYAPEIGMGMKTTEEVEDLVYQEVETTPSGKAKAKSTMGAIDKLNAQATDPGKSPENAQSDDGEAISDAIIDTDDDDGSGNVGEDDDDGMI